MKINFKKVNKAAIICLIVAFIISLSFTFLISIVFKDIFNMANMALKSLDNSYSTKTNDIIVENIDGKKLIKSYPYIGQKYGDIYIKSVGINLPIYFGDSNDILKYGVGHDEGSYFPGEGGSIIYGAHHSNDKFGKLRNIKINDIITVKTSYGEFNYKIHDIKIIKETDLHLLPIQRNNEVLMLYTCYPFGYLGYTTQRFAVYANIIDYDIGGDK